MAMLKLNIMPRLLVTAVIITILALTCQGKNVLLSGEKLWPGQSLDEGTYSFKMQNSFNLVLFDGDVVIWTSNGGFPNHRCCASMQTDGNFVIYDGQYNAVWSSHSWNGDKIRSYILVLQKDRNIVIYGPGLWSTNTNVESVGGIVHTVVNGTAGGGFIKSQSVGTMIIGEIGDQNATAVGKVAVAAL